MSKVQDQILASVGKQLTNMAGDALINYFTGQYKSGRDRTYDALTERKSEPTIEGHFTKGRVDKSTEGIPIPEDPRRTYRSATGEDPDMQEPTRVQQYWRKYAPRMEDGNQVFDQTVRPTQVDVDPIKNRATGKYEAYYNKLPKDYASWIPGFAYQNPETSAAVVGALNPIAQIGAATAIGAGIYNYSKPRSDYALAVQDSAQQGGYNPNVEAAQASAMYRAALEEQKFQHKMALMDARAQAATPGVQEYGAAVLGRQSPSGIPQMGDAYGMVNNMFKTPIPTYGV